MKAFLIIVISAFVVFSSFNSTKVKSPVHNYSITDDSVIFQKAEKLISAANTLKPKAQELKTVFEGLKSQAKKCPKALAEAEKGLDLAKKAVKSCDEVKTLVAKAKRARKDIDASHHIHEAEKKIHSVNYFMREADDRKKEIGFELKGCKG